MSARVRIDVSEMECTQTGSIPGVVYFERDGYCYPERNWSDFPVVVLGWWLPLLRSYASGSSDRCTLQFMDGPHKITVERLETETTLYSTSQRSKSRIGVVDLDRFLKSVVKAAEGTLEACAQHGWQNDDVELLKSAVAGMKDAS